MVWEIFIWGLRAHYVYLFFSGLACLFYAFIALCVKLYAPFSAGRKRHRQRMADITGIMERHPEYVVKKLEEMGK